MTTTPSQYGGNVLSLQITTLLYWSGFHVPVYLGAMLGAMAHSSLSQGEAPGKGTD